MKDISTLKAALKILKKGHKKCKDFNIKCHQCQYTMLIDLLDDEIEFRIWDKELKNK